MKRSIVVLCWICRGFDGFDLGRLLSVDIYGDEMPDWNIANDILSIATERLEDGTYGFGDIIATLDDTLNRI